MEIHDFKKKTRICFCVLSGPPLKILLSSQSWLSWHLGWYVRLVVSPHTHSWLQVSLGKKGFYLPCPFPSSGKGRLATAKAHLEEVDRARRWGGRDPLSCSHPPDNADSSGWQEGHKAQSLERLMKEQKQMRAIDLTTKHVTSYYP